ncbi:MAG TPA: hypothetical protein PLH23_04900 [Hyphomonadaceae bacterium]|nr:hypothetical protein [Hyphomonadaceae bacterium]HPI47584.1 hypothetical protein [Hyphomonadaceae bacterium]
MIDMQIAKPLNSPEFIRAVAKALFAEGTQLGWWPGPSLDYDVLDSVDREELDAIAERILLTAARTADAG